MCLLRMTSFLPFIATVLVTHLWKQSIRAINIDVSTLHWTRNGIHASQT